MRFAMRPRGLLGKLGFVDFFRAAVRQCWYPSHCYRVQSPTGYFLEKESNQSSPKAFPLGYPPKKQMICINSVFGTSSLEMANHSPARRRALARLTAAGGS